MSKKKQNVIEKYRMYLIVIGLFLVFVSGGFNLGTASITKGQDQDSVVDITYSAHMIAKSKSYFCSFIASASDGTPVVYAHISDPSQTLGAFAGFYNISYVRVIEESTNIIAAQLNPFVCGTTLCDTGGTSPTDHSSGVRSFVWSYPPFDAKNSYAGDVSGKQCHVEWDLYPIEDITGEVLNPEPLPPVAACGNGFCDADESAQSCIVDCSGQVTPPPPDPKPFYENQIAIIGFFLIGLVIVSYLRGRIW